MNYAELLKRMPAELRRRLETEVYGSWLQQGGTLADVCTDPVVMETLFNRISGTERAVLHCLVMRIGSEPFDYARLEKSSSAVMSGAEVKVGLTGLLRKGIVFAFRKTWGEYVYLLPADGFAHWRQMLLPEAGGALIGNPDTQIEVTGDSAAAYREELFHVLVYGAQQGLKLTKSGTLHKKQLQKLSEQIRLDDSRFAGAGLKYAYSDVYPLKIALVLDFLLRLQLLLPGEEQFMLNAEALQAWLSLPAEQQTRRLYMIWKQLTIPAQAWMQHAICLAEQSDGSGEWFSVEGIVNRLLGQGIAEDPRLAAEYAKELQERWLMPLAAFGWLEEGSGNDREQHAWYRWTTELRPAQGSVISSDAQEEAGFMVQPDFDVLVPPDVSGAVFWELCCLADPVQLDQVSIYKLTKNSVRRALENGRTVQDMLDYLQRHSMYGVPEHVRLTVEQWAKPYGKTVFRQAVLLRCADRETAQTIAKLPGAMEYLQEKLGEKDYVVQTSAVKPLIAALEKAGYMPGVPQWTAAVHEGPPSGAYPKLSGDASKGSAEPLPGTAEQGLLYTRTSVSYFEMEPRIPGIPELYPDLQEIPSVWLKDYRSYHASTRKEIVEKAIRLKTLLQIRKDGTDYRIEPHKVQEMRGSWCMTGIGRLDGTGNEIRLMAEEWQEMKLILPGINDKY